MSEIITPDLLNKSIKAMLDANSALVAALGSANNILESQFQGQIFVYPNVRIDANRIVPIGDAVGRVKLFDSTWTIYSYSELASSQEANNIAGLVVNALFNKQYTGKNRSEVDYFKFIRIDLVDLVAARRVADRIWMAIANFQSELHLINPQ